MHEELLARPRRLSDTLLLSETRGLVARERGVTAHLVAHLAEVERRELHLKHGYSSMFDYCRRGLGLSESEAYGRIEAARVVRSFPVLIDYLLANRLTFTVVGVIGRHLSAENHVRVLERASGLTKEQAKELVAQLAPKPDAATRLVRLPHPQPQPEPPSRLLPFGPAVPPAAFPAMPTMTGGAPPDSPDRGIPEASRSAPAPPLPKPPTPETRPLSPDRYLYRLTVDSETRDLLVQARELLGHAAPGKDDGELLKRALRLLVDEMMRTKFATRTGRVAARVDEATQPGKSARPVDSPTRRAGVAPPPPARPEGPRPIAPDSRHVPAAVRRAVFARDEGRCAYVGPDGVRCGDTRRIEFHHVRPWGIGGETSVANVQLRCQRHNLFESRQFYVREDLPPRGL